MMWWPDHGGWGWGGWLAMTLTMLAFWGLVAWVVVSLVRPPGWRTRLTTTHATSPQKANMVSLVRQPGGRREPGRDTEEILAERFARGEIDEDEFRQRRAALRSHR